MTVKKHNILVVDDNFIIRHNYKLILEKNGFGFIEAAKAEEGLEKLSSKNISLILLDLMMPGMSGLEFMEIARAKYKDTLPPVLVCSADSEVPVVKKMAEFGIAGYLLKPVDFKMLINKLYQIFPK
jgi:two-component system response regulator YesN